jgi:cytoskeletal protein CcmA (bactofilin family)
MGATYTRQSTFTDGDVITADLFNNEFDQLLAAFAVNTGHTHDGTAGEGGPISLVASDNVTIGTGAGDITLTWDGGSNDGVLIWSEDEDYFTFSDDILLATSEKLQFRDTAIYIHSSADGQLDLVADTEIQIAATTIDMNGAVDISGNLDIGGNLVVTGTTTFNGGTITLGDAATDNVVFAADVDSSIIPDDDDTYDLGSASQEWRNLFIDGTANIDTASIDNISDDTLVATDKKIQFRDTAIFINSSADGQLDIVADTEIQIAATTIDINGAVNASGEIIAASLDISGNVDIDGVTNLDVVDIDGAVNMATTALVTGVLTTTATQVATGGITSGSNIVSDTDSTDDLGTTSVRWANLFVDGITATDQITATGFTGTLDGILGSGAAATASVTTLDTSGAVNLNLATDSTSSTSGALIVDGGVGIAKKLFVGTTLGVTGVVTANAGVVVDEMTLDADTLTATDDFILDVAGNIEINADGGTITFKDDGATLGTVTSAGFSGLSATVAVSDSNANTNFPIVFHDESNALLDDTGALRYNPSTGELLVPNLTVAGTTTTVDTVTMEAANAIIFEGATADAHETTLTIVDPTADRTINMPNQSGTIVVLAAASNTAVTSTPEELNALDGITAVVGELNALDIGSTAVGTAVASKAVILDSNKDYTGIRNLTITGELDAATLDISGAIDVAGTSNLDVVDIDGAVDMASTLQVDGVATFTAKPIANGGLSLKNGTTSAGFIEFYEDGDNDSGANFVTLIGPASTADVTLTLPAATGTLATLAAAIDEATALAIALG